MPRKTAVKTDKNTAKATAAKTDKAKKPAKPTRKLPAAFRLFAQACTMPARHWEIFGGILLIYAVLNIVLIGGLVGSDELVALKDVLADTFTGQFGSVTTGLALFGFLITEGSGSVASGVASAYQTMLLLLISLALIWALRQVYAGHKVRVRDAFYQGMHPLVQYILVMLVIGLQLVPAVLGGFFFVILAGILQHTYELVLISIVLLALLSASVYMLISSVFALYIVTLPNMTPLEALRSAKDIVRYRRAKVLLKLLFLPLALIVAAAIIMVPVALLLTPLAAVMFFALSIVGVLIIHSYMYALYRELIA